MTEYKITCPDCSVSTTVQDGPTKFQALKNEPYRKVFFCAQTKVALGLLPSKAEFISLEVGPDTAREIDSSWAQKTQNAVEPGSEFFFYRHQSCEGNLIPLAFFLNAKPAPRCPICKSGKMNIEVLRFID